MAHVAKYTKGSVSTLTRHFERAKNMNGQYIEFGNQDIDISKTHLNYNLAPYRNQINFIKERCNQMQCLNRDDVKVLCSWVVTAPKSLPESDEKRFFLETYNFLKNKYGENNIVSAYVHMDETTPHIHFAFIPVAIDKKTGIEKVSAKEVLTRLDLKYFHQNLSNHMTNVFGYDIGILNAATKDGNKDVIKLKTNTALKELKTLEARISDLEALFSAKEKQAIEHYEWLKSVLQGKIDVFKRELPSFDSKLQQIKDKRRLEQLEKFFESLPAEIKKELFKKQLDGNEKPQQH